VNPFPSADALRVRGPSSADEKRSFLTLRTYPD
jgi:hypothetical protein